MSRISETIVVTIEIPIDKWGYDEIELEEELKLLKKDVEEMTCKMGIIESTVKVEAK